jgi:hypothetical protein
VPELAQLSAREGRLGGAAAAQHDDLLDVALAQRLERVIGDVRVLQLGGAQRQHPRHVGGDVAVADHDGAPRREVELEVAVVRVAVVPGDELCGSPAAGQILTRDAQRLVRLGAGRVDHGRVVAHELGVRDVDADLDVAQKAAAALERLAVERVLQALDLLVIGGDAAAQQAPRRRQPLEQVDLGVTAGPQQAGGRERAGGSGADDRHTRRVAAARRHRAVRSAVLFSPKNRPLRSSAYPYLSGTSDSA